MYRQKGVGKIISFFVVLKVTEEKSRIRSRIWIRIHLSEDPDPYPYPYVTDLEHWKFLGICLNHPFLGNLLGLVLCFGGMFIVDHYKQLRVSTVYVHVCANLVQ
jgi:hypothetical protein